MVSRRIECTSCNKKCSGNVLRYQNQYYHKQCFELRQKGGVEEKLSQIQLDQQKHKKQDLESIEQHQAPLMNSDTASNEILHSSVTKSSKFYSSKTITKTTPSASSQEISMNSGAASRYQPYNDHDSADKHHQQHTTYQDRQSNGREVPKSATLPHPSALNQKNGFVRNQDNEVAEKDFATCAGCKDIIKDSEALKALEKHWHVWCFKCTQCKSLLHGEYVAKDGKPYCERDYQKLFGVTCVYCKRYITGKVLQAGEAHHFHPSCARCSKCGDPFVPGEEMYLQGEITWHPRCGPGPDTLLDDHMNDLSARGSQLHGLRAHSPSLYSSRSRSVSPFSLMSRQYGRSSPLYEDSEAVGDLSRIYTISYLNADPAQGYLRRPIEPNPPKSPQFSRPVSSSLTRDRSRSSSRSHYRDRSVPRNGMYSILSGSARSSTTRPKSPSMQNEEAIQLSHYPAAQRPNPNEVAKIERDDFPAPPFPYTNERSSTRSVSGAESSVRHRDRQQTPSQDDRQVQLDSLHHGASSSSARPSRPRSRDLPPSTHLASGGNTKADNNNVDGDDPVSFADDDSTSNDDDPRLRKEEKELSKIATGIGKIFLNTLKEREKLRAWKKANLDPRNASRTPSAQRELPNRMRYDNPRNASPSRDMQRPRHWDDDDDHSPARSAKTRSQASASSSYGYKVVPSTRSTPRPGYGVTAPVKSNEGVAPHHLSAPSPSYPNGNRSAIDLQHQHQQPLPHSHSSNFGGIMSPGSDFGHVKSAYGAHLRRSMPNVNHLNNSHSNPPKLYPYHLLVTSNYRLPSDVDRCHLERHLSNEEFQYIFHCDRLDFYRLPEWRRNELKRRARLF